MVLLAVMTAMASASGPSPAALAHSKEAAVSIKTYSAVTVDGTLDDWVRRLESSNWNAQLEVKNGQTLKWIRAAPMHVNALTGKVESGNVKGPEDFSATIFTLWDDQHFYVVAVVTDDEVITQHEGADIWQDDALEIWFDCRHDSVTHTLSQDDEYQLGFSPASKYRNRALSWAWRNPHTGPVKAAMEVAASLTPTGYILEGSVPWAVLEGCQPSIGRMVGFNISMVDKDEDQLWTHVTWAGQLHSDPSQFGHLYFVDAPIDLFPSDVFEFPSGVSLWEGSPSSTSSRGDREPGSVSRDP